MSDDVFDPEIHAVDKDGNPSLNKDGSFRKKRRDSRGGNPSKKSATSGVSGGSQRERYRAGVAGVLQIPAAILSMVDPVDGYCAAQYVGPMSEAVADLAVENPQVAAAVERMAQAGPLGAVLSVGIMAAVQFAHNHGKVPASMAKALGATPREEIERTLQARGEQIVSEAEKRKREDAEDRAASESVQRVRAEGVSHDYAAA